jgi:chemotaxis protein methyltransferase CheR
MDFNQFIGEVHRKFSLNLGAYKEKQLKRRIESLISTTGAKGYQEYFELLCKDSAQLERFFDKITINVSEFFRNAEIFQSLEKAIFPQLCAGNQKLKIWSAACSNGSEPYSLAMILNECFPGVSFTINATDIDANILKSARRGVYDEKAIKGVSGSRLQKYFTRNGANMYQVIPELKRHVQFKKHDLLEDEFEKDYDLIVCRNVMIYFTRETQNDLYRKMYDSLKDGGVLFIGATETIAQYKDYGFDKVSHWFYRKPEYSRRCASVKLTG